MRPQTFTCSGAPKLVLADVEHDILAAAGRSGRLVARAWMVICKR
jgi:hypothetical protein